MAKAMTNFEAFRALEDIDDVEVEVTPKKKVIIKESINESVDDYYVLSDGNPRHARIFAEIRDIDEFINNIDAKDRKLELSHFVNGKETKIWDSEKGKVNEGYGDDELEFDSSEEAEEYARENGIEHFDVVWSQANCCWTLIIDESCKVEEDSNRELIPHFDSRNSFYNKARVVEKDDGTKILYSYATPVCRIKDGKATLLKKGYLGWNSSQTTLRHVKEFLKQNGFDADSLKQLEKNYPEEQAVNEDYQDLDFSWNDICKEIIDKVKEVLDVDIEANDIFFDDSRAYSLYVLGDKLGLPVYKFGAYRNYLGGGMQGGTEHNGREKEGTVELGEFFAEKLDEISNILMEPSEDEEENESLKKDKKLKEFIEPEEPYKTCGNLKYYVAKYADVEKEMSGNDKANFTIVTKKVDDDEHIGFNGSGLDFATEEDAKKEIDRWCELKNESLEDDGDINYPLARRFGAMLLPPQKKPKKRYHYELYWYDNEEWNGDAIFKEFPSMKAAQKWYDEHKNDSDKFGMTTPSSWIEESLKESTHLKENTLVNLNDEDEVKDAKERIESEEKEEPTEKIIDADAETIDKTKESYLGDAVLICHKCRRTIFKKPEELVKDEKSELYNIEDICPNCGAQSGYELGGQIADINAPDKEDEEDVEVKEKEEVKVEPEQQKDDVVDDIKKEVEVKKEESLSNFEEIDNEGMDKLLTEHLTSVYENIESFTTKNAEVKDNSLMLEGVIKYKSGKEKNTSVVFEDCKIGKKKNKVKLIGKCEALSKSNKALSFLMKSEDNKLFCESLFCNYDVKVNDEEKIVRGRYLNK